MARLGHADSLAYADFPVADPALLVAETVTYPVQVNGKVRGRIEVAADADRGDGARGGAGRGRGVAGRPGAAQGHRGPRPDGQSSSDLAAAARPAGSRTFGQLPPVEQDPFRTLRDS